MKEEHKPSHVMKWVWQTGWVRQKKTRLSTKDCPSVYSSTKKMMSLSNIKITICQLSQGKLPNPGMLHRIKLYKISPKNMLTAFIYNPLLEIYGLGFILFASTVIFCWSSSMLFPLLYESLTSNFLKHSPELMLAFPVVMSKIHCQLW